MNVSIRLANNNDIPLLADVERSASTAFRILPTYNSNGDTIAPEILNEMAAAKLLWVACDDKNQPLGFVGCRKIDGFLYIYEISVAFDFQKHGIGRRLMITVIDAAVKEGYKIIGLTTNRQIVWNKPFYQSLGFIEMTEGETLSGLDARLQKEIAEGADPLTRCAMIKRLA